MEEAIVKQVKPKKQPAEKAAKAAKPAQKQVKITLLKSTIGCLENQKRTVQALGLKKIRSSRTFADSEELRGMIFVVKHLVKVEEVL